MCGGEGQILALALGQKSLQRFKFFHFRLEACRVNPDGDREFISKRSVYNVVFAKVNFRKNPLIGSLH